MFGFKRVLDPEKITDWDERKRIARWLRANGETEWVVLTPITLQRKYGTPWAHYEVWPMHNWPHDEPKRMVRHITVPLRKVA